MTSSPALTSVMACVARGAHQLKILWTVIPAQSILVMDYLTGFKEATEDGLHYHSMLSSISQYEIAVFLKLPYLLCVPPTLVAADAYDPLPSPALAEIVIG